MNQICAHEPQGRTDVCEGASGGPLQMADLLGVSTATLPSTSTRVAFYVDWIEKTVWPDS